MTPINYLAIIIFSLTTNIILKKWFTILKKFDRINENLTYYRRTENNISSNFRKFSKNWWKRRSQAHEYFRAFCKNNDIKFKKNLDYLFTKFVCLFI